MYPLVPDGERVAAGAPVALAGETGAELFRAALLLRVRVELASDMLPVPGGQALRSLSEALARRDFSALGAALPEARRSLGYAATGGNALRQEEEALLSSGAEETLVHAPRAGYFSAHGADGTMTVVSGSGWTFTAPLNEKTAARLPGGGSAVLLLPDETRVTAAVRITDAGEAVFSCGTHLESVLSLNECTLTVLLAEWQGYSVPESAILPGEDGRDRLPRVRPGAGIRPGHGARAARRRGAHRITDAARRHERAAFPRGGQRAIVKIEYPFFLLNTFREDRKI